MRRGPHRPRRWAGDDGGGRRRGPSRLRACRPGGGADPRGIPAALGRRPGTTVAPPAGPRAHRGRVDRGRRRLVPPGRARQRPPLRTLVRRLRLHRARVLGPRPGAVSRSVRDRAPRRRVHRPPRVPGVPGRRPWQLGGICGHRRQLRGRLRLRRLRARGRRRDRRRLDPHRGRDRARGGAFRVVRLAPPRRPARPEASTPGARLRAEASRDGVGRDLRRGRRRTRDVGATEAGATDGRPPRGGAAEEPGRSERRPRTRDRSSPGRRSPPSSSGPPRLGPERTGPRGRQRSCPSDLRHRNPPSRFRRAASPGRGSPARPRRRSALGDDTLASAGSTRRDRQPGADRPRALPRPRGAAGSPAGVPSCHARLRDELRRPTRPAPGRSGPPCAPDPCELRRPAVLAGPSPSRAEGGPAPGPPRGAVPRSCP